MKFIYLLLIVTLTACGTTNRANRQLKKAERAIEKAKLLGAEVNPDTIFTERTILIPVPGDSNAFQVEAVIDLESFILVSDANDSLVREIDHLSRAIEPDLKRIKAANAEISRLKKRLAQGFQKDSVYRFAPDSLTEINIRFKDGLASLLTYNRQPGKIKHIEIVPVEVNNSITSGHSTMVIVQWSVLIGLICLIVGHFRPFSLIKKFI
jgi:hypothetical protein